MTATCQAPGVEAAGPTGGNRCREADHRRVTRGVARGRARLGRAPHLDFVGADACYFVVNRGAAWPRHRPVPQVRRRELTRLTKGGQWAREALRVELNTKLASVLEDNLQLEMPEHAEARDP